METVIHHEIYARKTYINVREDSRPSPFVVHAKNIVDGSCRLWGSPLYGVDISPSAIQASDIFLGRANLESPNQLFVGS